MHEIDAAYEIERLIEYAKQTHLIETDSKQHMLLNAIFLRNNLMALLNVDTPYQGNLPQETTDLHEILDHLMIYAVNTGMIEDTTTDKDLLDTKIMGLLTPCPSAVTHKFYSLKESSGSQAATDYFYQLNQDVNYIRMNRIKKNRHWTVQTQYGEIEMTINLSKPEKDPLELKKALNIPSTGYPKCVLCIENMGYQGDAKKPARQNHRLIPLELCQENWYFQYSPYVYYNEHCILIYENHKPMHICKRTFSRLFQFLDEFPLYFIGSNTDLPIVGGSILEHEHYQGGRYRMPMVDAKIESAFETGISNVKAGILHWPLSCIRLSSNDKEKLIDLSHQILTQWRQYTDESVDIFHETLEGSKTVPHNTVTPISRINKEGEYEIDIVLRNNRTTDEYPRGLFHPHPELHHIKKENIGLIEVMGLAILPGRLESEIEAIADYLTGVKDIAGIGELDEDHSLFKHRQWIQQMHQMGICGTHEQVMSAIRMEIGKRFTRVLEDAGVYKNNPQGQEAFQRFMNVCGFKLV
ncbi:MAG TPA: UDP-glucose--hexose-1-phosphate uridylyltransferase [Thermotogota bacterium]|nr:UDP-glucose--hexose-1-phosphate uridylyltransferase [Thermotogota bacterium]HRW33920.1 UDP-glucose--hexose-1-phosphate uridylyltransferase [Thermotogota bacterium]